MKDYVTYGRPYSRKKAKSVRSWLPRLAIFVLLALAAGMIWQRAAQPSSTSSEPPLPHKVSITLPTPPESALSATPPPQGQGSEFAFYAALPEAASVSPPITKPSQPTPPDQRPLFALHLGGFSEQAQAQQIFTQMKELGWSAQWHHQEAPWVVALGPFASAEAAEATRAHLAHMAIPQQEIVEYQRSPSP